MFRKGVRTDREGGAKDGERDTVAVVVVVGQFSSKKILILISCKWPRDRRGSTKGCYEGDEAGGM